MKNQIISIILIGYMTLSLTACGSSGNRETTFNGETMDTVNAYVSQPEQSIAGDALITTETTTETTVEKNGNTYVINGVEFTISHPIEDYVYTLPGSDLQFIDLDGFMEAYGFHTNYTDERKEFGDSYKNDGGFTFGFDIYEFSLYNSGIGICENITITNKSRGSLDGTIGLILLSRYHTIDSERTYGVNGYISEKSGNLRTQYCLTQEVLVIIAVIAECYDTTGSSDSVVDSVSSACAVRPQGQRLVVEVG